MSKRVYLCDMTLDGEKVGELWREMSSEQYASEKWALQQLRLEWQKVIKESDQVFTVPVVENEIPRACVNPYCDYTESEFLRHSCPKCVSEVRNKR